MSTLTVHAEPPTALRLRQLPARFVTHPVDVTAAGAVVGRVLGTIGVWKSRLVMSAIGAALCVVAVMPLSLSTATTTAEVVPAAKVVSVQ